jgi:serine/threonine-protein kinase
VLFDAIASGGMATVYLARMRGHEGFARLVAVKQLYPHFALDQEFVAMFLDEARISSRIRHPNVVAPLDILVEGSELFLAMEYVHGEALSTLAALAKAPLTPNIASAILIQVLLGLHAAHEAVGDDGSPLEIVHRDVSPQNILVGLDGLARVVDFGIAKATSRARTTQDGRLKGKLGYMAPEQIRQLPNDRRVDVFTSGVVLWELLTGRQLFMGDHPAVVLESILRTEITPPSVHNPAVAPALEAVVMCALSQDPDARFDTTKAMATALSQATPVASALEVSAWVEALAGPGLSARARRIAEVERASTSELGLPSDGPEEVPEQPKARTADVPTPTLVVPESAPAQVTRVPEPQTDLSLIPSSATHRFRPGSGRRLVFLALGATAVGAVALGWALAPPNDPEPHAGASTGSARAGVAPAPAAELDTVAGRARPEPPDPSPTPTRNVLVVPANVPSARAPSVPPSASARSAATSPARPPPRPSAPPRPARARPDCRVPYLVDTHGIKRFKPECFR